MSRDRAGLALSDRGPARLRSRPSGPGQAHRAFGADEARSPGASPGGAASTRTSCSRARGRMSPSRSPSSPILAVALDTVEGAPELNEALRMTTERILATLPSARLACVNVLKLNRIAIDKTLDEQGSNKHIDRLVALRHWATPLKLDESRLSVHVLEAVDPAAALLEFAEMNSGRPSSSSGRGRARSGVRWLGSVSAKVACRGDLHRHGGAAAADGWRRNQTPAWCGARKDQAAWAVWTSACGGSARRIAGRARRDPHCRRNTG